MLACFLILVMVLSIAVGAVCDERPAVHPKAGPLDNRLCRIESRAGGPVKGNPAEWVDWIAEAGVDLWVCSAVDAYCNVNYPSKVGFPSGDFDPDYIPKLVKLAHKRDIAVMSWIGPVWSAGAAKTHPEWTIVHLDDPTKPPLKSEDGWNLCPNNPKARAFLKAEFSEIVGPLGFDGIWFDGTVFGSMGTIPFRIGCRCSHCTAKYKADTGFDIPQKVDINDMNFRRFIRWRYQVMDEYMADIYRTIKEANPKAQVHYGNYYRPGHGWDAGTYMASQKWPGTISGENNIVGDQAYETVNTGFNARMMKAINPYSFELWRPMWDFQVSFLIHPEIVQTKVCLLLQFAQGGHTFCGYGGSGKEAVQDLKPAYDELKRRAKWHGGEPLRYAAMHYSQRARDFVYPGGAHEYDKMASGVHQMLAESHVIFDFVLDGQLTLESLKRFKVVVLPSSGCINEQEAKALKEYVENGGHLIVAGETSLYDDLGQKREDFLLANLTGAHYKSSMPFPPYPKTYPAGVIQSPDLLKDLPRSIWFMSGFCEVAADNTVKPEVIISMAQGREVAGSRDDAMQPSDEPLALSRKLGRGKVIYLAADLGRGYAEHSYQRIRKLFLKWVSEPGQWLNVDAPKVIEATAFEKNAETIIHLVNSPLTTLRPTVMTGRLPLVDEVVPVHDLGVSIQGDFTRARLEPSGIDLAVEKKDGWCRVKVPKVDIHEMVVWRK